MTKAFPIIKSNRWLWALILPIIVMVVCTAGCSNAPGPSETTRTGLIAGMEAPEIIGSNLAGEKMRLSDFRGKVVVLEFWFST